MWKGLQYILSKVARCVSEVSHRRYELHTSATTCGGLRQRLYIFMTFVPRHYIAIFMPSRMPPSAVPPPRHRCNLIEAHQLSYINPRAKQNSGMNCFQTDEIRKALNIFVHKHKPIFISFWAILGFLVVLKGLSYNYVVFSSSFFLYMRSK